MIRQRLETYKRQKRREEMRESFRNTMRNFLTWRTPPTEEEPLKEILTPDDEEDTESTSSEDTVDKSRNILHTVTYFLYLLLWIILYVVAIEWEFGAVYFVITALIFICLNTSSRPKKRGVPSAYSVFNPNCEAIDGTLDASQFDKEIRFGAGSVR